VTTIAILSVSAGAGHVRCAQALVAEALARGVKAVHVDVMDLVPALFRKLYAQSYLKVVERHPALWGYLYTKSDRPGVVTKRTKLRQIIERLNTRKLAAKLEELQPDAVVCTHFLPAQLISRMIRKRTFAQPTWVQVTDFDVHALWIHERMAGYFAADEEVAWRMQDRGIPASTISVTGIPIMPVFGERRSRVECARELAIDPEIPTVLMMSGGFGVGDIDLLAERLLRTPGFQIIALAGRNEALLKKLSALARAHRGRLFPMGFTKTIERVMTCADLAITKPGGLTASECLAVGLPMIVVSPIPGQEERNADFLLESGAALKAYDAAGLEFRTLALLRDRKRLAAMRESALRTGKPDAARAVMGRVLGSLGAAQRS
jgi:processive 1,2-diacylglycerol beta-glucosyltransferase